MMERYTVLGPDGAEYGPATLDELAAWKHQGRVANDSRVRVVSTGATVRASDLLGQALPAPPRIPAPIRQPVPTPPWVIPALVGLGVCLCLLPVGLGAARGFSAAGSAMRGSAEYQSGRRVAGALVAISRGDGKIPDLRKPSELIERVKPFVSADVARDAARMDFHDELSGLDINSLEPTSNWLLHTRKNGSGRVTVCYLNGMCQVMPDDWIDQLPQEPVGKSAKPAEI